MSFLGADDPIDLIDVSDPYKFYAREHEELHAAYDYRVYYTKRMFWGIIAFLIFSTVVDMVG